MSYSPATGQTSVPTTNAQETGAVSSVVVSGATDTADNTQTTQTFVNSVADAVASAGFSDSTPINVVSSVSVPKASNAQAIDPTSINVVSTGTTTAITNTDKTTPAVAVIGSDSTVTIAGGKSAGIVNAVVASGSTITATGKANVTFTDGTGTANVTTGSNTVNTGDANVTVSAGGKSTVNLGSGSSTVNVASGANTIVGGSGSSTVTFQGGNNTYYGATGSDSVKSGSGQDSIYGGTDNNASYGVSGETITGSGSTYIQGGAGNTINLKGADTLDGAWGGKIKPNGQWGGSDTVVSGGALGSGQLIDGTGNGGQDPNNSSAHGHLEIYVNAKASDTIIGGDDGRYNNAAKIHTPQQNVALNVAGADSTQAGTGANGVFILSASDEAAVGGKDSLFGGSAHDVVYVAQSSYTSITANTGAGGQFTTITFANGQSLQLHNVDVVLDPTKHP